LLKRISPPLQVYGLAVLTVAAALALVLLLDPVLPNRPSVLFLAAVIISAQYRGLRSGLAATVLSVVCLSYFFFPPTSSLMVSEFEHIMWLVLFVTVAVLISSLNESRQKAEEQLRLSNQELEKRVSERTSQLTGLNQRLEAGYASLEQITKEKEKLIHELQNTLGQLRALKEMLPVCVYCQRIRSDKGEWKQLEAHMSEETEETFSRSVCPDCGKQILAQYPFVDSAHKH
jgi:K+-sensing histidine kinase KdpD